MSERTPFAEVIRTLRLEKKLALTEFCEKINVEASVWSKIERNILPPPMPEDKIWLRIINTLNLDTDTIYELFAKANYTREMPRYKITRAEAISMLPAFICRDKGPLDKEETEKLILLIMEENGGVE